MEDNKIYQILMVADRYSVGSVINSTITDIEGYWDDLVEDADPDGLPTRAQVRSIVHFLVGLTGQIGLTPDDFDGLSALVKEVQDPSWLTG